ncbi:MAG TPA: hypothetical protein VHX61_02210 [Rhizomicrobium sp.]|nr:hypothetical protein [Rhizomicrobium sp.]
MLAPGIGINADGSVTGWFFDSDERYYCFIRAADGSFTVFHAKAGGLNYALSINHGWPGL